MDRLKSLGLDQAQLKRRDQARTGRSSWYLLLLTLVALLVVGLVLGVVMTIAVKGASAVNWTFLTHAPEDNMSKGGIAPMILGSVYLLLGTLLTTLPLGVLGGVFLSEYAGARRWVGLARAMITSLAGTPSIIYGLFGFAVFVLLVTGQASLLAGILTLTVMALPIVVLSTETSIRNVPQSQIEAGYALGLTRWQVVWKVVLPQAVPGIMTGLVLATGRAMGEAPPILLTAGIFYTTAQPHFSDILHNPVMNLPYHLTEAIKQSTTFTEQQVWGTCLVLLALMLILNLSAILIRARQRKRKAA